MISGKIAKQRRTMTPGSTISRPELRSIHSSRLSADRLSAFAVWARVMCPSSVAGSVRPAAKNAEKAFLARQLTRQEDSRGEGSALDAERPLVELQLAVDADLLIEIVPAVEDRLDGLLSIELAGEVARDGLIEHDLLVLLVLRNAQIENHIRAIQAVLDRAEIGISGDLAHARVFPSVVVDELARAIGIKSRGADRNVDVRLLGLRQVGDERVGRVLALILRLHIDAAAPAAKRGVGRVVHPIDRVRAAVLGAGLELAGRPVHHFLRAGRDDGSGLVDPLRGLWVDRKHADVAPIEVEGALAGHEQRARIADVHVEFVRRPILARLLEEIERLAEAFVVDQGLHVLGVEECALARPLGL